MGVYRDCVLPWLIELSLGKLGELRKPALAPASGDVLEVGFGTGLNLPHYSPAVRQMVALDPMHSLRRRVQARIAAAAFPVTQVRRRADEGLPFEDGSFDCVVTTWTLCSIAQPEAALAEMRRVLRPQGRYLFLEHGLSEDARVARWQRRLTPLQRWIGGGCRLDLAIGDVVTRSGFTLLDLKRFVPPELPRISGEMYQGVAAPGEA